MHEKGPAERRGREKGEVLEANRELELLQEELLRDRAGGAGERGDSDGDENLATWSTCAHQLPYALSILQE